MPPLRTPTVALPVSATVGVSFRCVRPFATDAVYSVVAAAKAGGVRPRVLNGPEALVALLALRPLSLASVDRLDPLGGVPDTVTHSLGSWWVASSGFVLSARTRNW